MKIQEAKITRDGFSTYYFQHSFRSGKQHAKDINAAINILNEGLRLVS